MLTIKHCPTGTTKPVAEIKRGQLYYADHGIGRRLYLRLESGLVDLDRQQYWPLRGDEVISNYTPVNGTLTVTSATPEGK